MLIQTWVATGILVGLAALGFAQRKPDFSGEWTLDRQASTLSPGADAVQTGTVRIEQRDPTFRYKATLVSQRAARCSTNTSCRWMDMKWSTLSREGPWRVFAGTGRPSYSRLESSEPMVN
jgi:hypothetical protein